MKKYNFIDITTADVAYEAYGRDLNELFSNAALAMFEVMVETDTVSCIVKKKVSVRGEDLESLMFNWLNELLYFYGAENMLFSKFEVSVDIKKYELTAKICGEKINPKRHELKTEVKAATYHKMKIWNKNNMWIARVILDI